MTNIKYLKENNLLSAHEHFMKLSESYVPNFPEEEVDEADDQGAQDPNAMGSDPSQDPSAMGGDPSAMGNDMTQDPSAMGVDPSAMTLAWVMIWLKTLAWAETLVQWAETLAWVMIWLKTLVQWA